MKLRACDHPVFLFSFDSPFHRPDLRPPMALNFSRAHVAEISSLQGARSWLRVRSNAKTIASDRSDEHTEPVTMGKRMQKRKRFVAERCRRADRSGGCRPLCAPPGWPSASSSRSRIVFQSGSSGGSPCLETSRTERRMKSTRPAANGLIGEVSTKRFVFVAIV